MLEIAAPATTSFPDALVQIGRRHARFMLALAQQSGLSFRQAADAAEAVCECVMTFVARHDEAEVGRAWETAPRRLAGWLSRELPTHLLDRLVTPGEPGTLSSFIRALTDSPELEQLHPRASFAFVDQFLTREVFEAQELLLLLYRDHLTFQEIAALTGTPEPALRTQANWAVWTAAQAFSQDVDAERVMRRDGAKPSLPPQLADYFDTLSAFPAKAGYVVTDLIGDGGQARVHLARPRDLPGLHVAIKEVWPPGGDPSHAEELRELRAARLKREANALLSIDDRAVVRCYGHREQSGGTEEESYIVMEYVDGWTLRDHMHDERLVGDPWEIAAFVGEIARGMAVAHARGVLHRDLKPSNILIRRGDLQPVVVDFGVAKLVGAEALTKFGKFLGTLPYLAPELFESGHAADEQTDVYSLGVLFFEMLTGRGPRTKHTYGVTDFDEVRPPRRPVPVELREWCLQCVARDRGERVCGMTALRSGLETLSRFRSASDDLFWRRGEAVAP